MPSIAWIKSNYSQSS